MPGVASAEAFGLIFSAPQQLVGLGPPCHITIDIADKDQRKKQTVMKEGVQETYYVFTGNDTVAGEVAIKMEGKKIEHFGIKIELIGQIGVSDNARPLGVASANCCCVQKCFMGTSTNSHHSCVSWTLPES